MVLSWGRQDALHHMIIDGGRRAAYPHLREQLKLIASRGEALSLFVLTHVDADHIEGALAFAQDRARPLEPLNVWFNGHRQLRAPDRRSIRQGDEYSTAIKKHGWPLNKHFTRRIASIECAEGPIDVDGLKVTMLSPNSRRLALLAERWDTWLKKQAERAAHGRRQGLRRTAKQSRNPIPDPLVLDELIADGSTDTEVANGSSIAFIAEWQGRRVLFAGDAHSDVLTSSLAPLAEAEGGRYRIDLLKASHHGSTNNTSRHLIEMLECRSLLISSNGNYHDHPDPQSIARFLHFGPSGPKKLYFNYETDRTRPWADTEAMKRYGYDVFYTQGEQGILQIDLMR